MVGATLGCIWLLLAAMSADLLTELVGKRFQLQHGGRAKNGVAVRIKTPTGAA